MNEPTEIRNDSKIQVAAQNILVGVAPERSQELSEFWGKYSPRFNLLTDTNPEGTFILDAGCYRDVRFNHRAMRAFWLASFIAWEGFERIHETATMNIADFSRFEEMIKIFFRILEADDTESINLPAGVPEPGHYPNADEGPSKRAVAELATFATGWALLHEVRHLQHQQEGTGAELQAQIGENHAEELSCDEFATRYILDKVDDYSHNHSVSVEQVRHKRQLGIYFAMFAMTLIGAEHWESSDSHPPMQMRIDAAITQMGTTGTAMPDAVAHAAFAALWNRWPDAPGPFKTTE